MAYVKKRESVNTAFGGCLDAKFKFFRKGGGNT